jgi:hypothetical protein
MAGATRWPRARLAAVADQMDADLARGYGAGRSKIRPPYGQGDSQGPCRPELARFMKPLLYPLSYGGARRRVTPRGGPVRNRSALTFARSRSVRFQQLRLRCAGREAQGLLLRPTGDGAGEHARVDEPLNAAEVRLIERWRPREYEHGRWVRLPSRTHTWRLLESDDGWKVAISSSGDPAPQLPKGVSLRPARPPLLAAVAAIVSAAAGGAGAASPARASAARGCAAAGIRFS